MEKGATNFLLGGRVFFYVLFLFFASPAFAQIAILERNISLEVRQEPISEVLKKISTQGNFTFSYNPSIIEGGKSISFSANQQTVRELLQMIFQHKITYKERGKYLILQQQEERENDEIFYISGYIFDQNTGKRLAQASVYEPIAFASAVSNQYGFYQLRLPAKQTQITIRAAKQHYQSQKLVLGSKKNQHLNIMLTAENVDTVTITEIRRQDSLSIRSMYPALPDSLVIRMIENKTKESSSLAVRLKSSFSNFFTSANQKINMLNIRDILSKKWQIGLLPYLSTNQLMGNTEVDFSLNLLAGYNAGVRKAEFGGLANIVRNDVRGVQAAGLFNLVGKGVKGAQIAGLGNIVGGDVKFAQAGGLFNVNIGSMKGAQAAGLFNYNYQNSKGIQTAGLFNFQRGNYGGIQMSGLFNFTSKELTGVQVSGLFNFAKKVKNGVQIGIFNYVDSAETAIPIGIFNYINKGGYHPIELSINEMAFTNITFKTGVKKIYTMLTVGMQPQQVAKRLWHFGYGIGSYWALGKTTAVSLDLTVHHLSQDSFSQYLNLLNRASISFEKRWKWWSIAAGPAWNIFITDISSPNYQPIFDDFPQLGFYQNEQATSGLRMRSWIGGQLALRFGK